MTEFLSPPNAQIQWEPLGIWNREKLHLELKYFGNNDDDKLNEMEQQHLDIQKIFPRKWKVNSTVKRTSREYNKNHTY